MLLIIAVSFVFLPQFENLINIWDFPSTEQDMVKYSQDYGILTLKNVFINGHNMRLYVLKSKQWLCSPKNCNKLISIKKGAWLDSKIIFVTALKFIVDETINIVWMMKKTVEFQQQDSDHMHTSIWKLYKLTYRKLIGITWNKEKILEVCSYVTLVLYWHYVTLIGNTYICNRKR